MGSIIMKAKKMGKFIGSKRVINLDDTTVIIEKREINGDSRTVQLFSRIQPAPTKIASVPKKWGNVITMPASE